MAKPKAKTNRKTKSETDRLKVRLAAMTSLLAGYRTENVSMRAHLAAVDRALDEVDPPIKGSAGTTLEETTRADRIRALAAQGARYRKERDDFIREHGDLAAIIFHVWEALGVPNADQDESVIEAVKGVVAARDELAKRDWVQCTTVSNKCLGGCRTMEEHDRSRFQQLTKERDEALKELQKAQKGLPPLSCRDGHTARLTHLYRVLTRLFTGLPPRDTARNKDGWDVRRPAHLEIPDTIRDLVQDALAAVPEELR